MNICMYLPIIYLHLTSIICLYLLTTDVGKIAGFCNTGIFYEMQIEEYLSFTKHYRNSLKTFRDLVQPVTTWFNIKRMFAKLNPYKSAKNQSTHMTVWQYCNSGAVSATTLKFQFYQQTLKHKIARIIISEIRYWWKL